VIREWGRGGTAKMESTNRQKRSRLMNKEKEHLCSITWISISGRGPVRVLGGLREDGPYFNGVTVVQQGVPFGDLYRFLKTGCLNEPVTCDPFLGFRKRAVRHTFSAGKDLAFRRELMPAFHLSLIAHSFEPGVELFHGILCIFRREPFIEPGASANH
jgi:hypothetical protein